MFRQLIKMAYRNFNSKPVINFKNPAGLAINLTLVIMLSFYALRYE